MQDVMFYVRDFFKEDNSNWGTGWKKEEDCGYVTVFRLNQHPRKIIQSKKASLVFDLVTLFDSCNSSGV